MLFRLKNAKCTINHCSGVFNFSGGSNAHSNARGQEMQGNDFFFETLRVVDQNECMWGLLLCIIGSQGCLLFNLPPEGGAEFKQTAALSPAPASSSSKLSKQFSTNIVSSSSGGIRTKFNLGELEVHRERLSEVLHTLEGGTSQASSITLKNPGAIFLFPARMVITCSIT